MPDQWLPCKAAYVSETLDGNIRASDEQNIVILEFKKDDTKQENGQLFIRNGAILIYHSVVKAGLDQLAEASIESSELIAGARDVCARLHLCLDCGAGKIVGTSKHTFSFPCRPGNC